MTQKRTHRKLPQSWGAGGVLIGALLILLLTFYMAKPVEFSTFPSMLLIATLFRLALNISATRLILRDADAGQVIGAIGSYVVGGNYVIGFIVFIVCDSFFSYIFQI